MSVHARLAKLDGNAIPSGVLNLLGLAPLSPLEQELVRTASGNPEKYQREEILMRKGTTLIPRILLSGWACSSRSFPDGHRQIIEFFLPGDIIGYSPSPCAMALADCACLTEATLADASALVRMALENPASGFVQVLQRAEEARQAQLIAQIVRIGGQPAIERVASLLLEFHERLTRAGLVSDDGTFDVPLNQQTLGEGLGLSLVHFNRCIKQLERANLVALWRPSGYGSHGGTMVTIPAVHALRILAQG